MQHEFAGGPLGIFGEEAKKHDLNIREVTELLYRGLCETFPHFQFRIRNTVLKQEINRKLHSIDDELGQVLFLENASVKPDGGVLEIKDKWKNWRVILVGESTKATMLRR